MTSSFTPDPSLRGAARVARWLAEDVGPGDVTTEAIVPAEARAEAVWVAKSDGVVAGLDEALEVFRALDPELEWQPQTGEGAWVEAGTELVRFSGGEMHLVSTQARAPGERLRLRVQARDVSLTLARQEGTSILNILPARVLQLREDGPGQAMVALDAGGTALLARVTQRSAQALALMPGMPVFAQVKGVALLD